MNGNKPRTEELCDSQNPKPIPSQKIDKTVGVFGDVVGKTNMISMFVTGKPYDDFCPTVFDVQAKVVEVQDTNSKTLDNRDGKKTTVRLSIADTSSCEDYSRLRRQIYPNCDAAIFCFSLTSISSLKNLLEVYYKELVESQKQIPIIMVGTQAEVRLQSQRYIVPEEAIQKVFKSMNCASYLECSSFANVGVNEVFLAAAKASLATNNTKRKSTRCSIM